MKQTVIDFCSRGPAVTWVWTALLLFLLLLSLPSSIMAAPEKEVKNDETPAMVQRHLFSPEEEKPVDKAQGPRSEAATKLEKELLFTGVIHSPQGKWAIIRPRNKSKREDAPWRLSEGDEIKGYHVKEIGPNYIVLTRNDKPVRLDLYRGTKQRPAPPPEPRGSTIPTPKKNSGGPGQTGRTVNAGIQVPGVRSKTVSKQKSIQPSVPIPQPANKGKPATKRAATPFAELLKRAQQNKQNGGTAPENPFSRMIRQQQQNK